MESLNIIDADEPWYSFDADLTKIGGEYNLLDIDEPNAAEASDTSLVDIDRAGGSEKPREEVIELSWFTGGAETYRLDTTKYKKAGVAELIPDKVSECSIIVNGRKTCVDADVEKAVLKATGAGDMNEAKQKTACDSEKCAVQKSLSGKVSGNSMKSIMATFFKPDGPTDTALLSNINIDAIMKQFEIKWPEFFAYNFNMRDYAEYSFRDGEVVHSPDTLATITWQDINARGKRCCGCIINSDVYTGQGKHWMALFADWRGSQRTIEFFNSSGNAPAPEFCNWMVKTKIAMGGECINVNKIRHQHTKTECGVYALFYIWGRLSGKTWQDFTKEPIPDQAMFEFRQHLFAGGTDFDYGKFRAGNKISWEDGHNDGEQSKHDL